MFDAQRRSFFSLGRGITEVLEFFEWRDVAIMYSDNKIDRKCFYVNEAIQSIVRSDEYQIDTYEYRTEGKRATVKEMDEFLSKLPGRFRSEESHVSCLIACVESVFSSTVSIVCLDQLEDRRSFMLRVRENGMDTDEYVYILPDYVGAGDRTELWIDHSENPDNRDKEARTAFEKALIVSHEITLINAYHRKA